MALVDRTFDVLERLAERERGLSLGVLARELDLPKSAAHRLLTALVDRGYVRQDEPNGPYALTLKVVGLGFRHLAATGLVDVCQPILDRLARATGELVRLAVADGDGLLWVGRAQGAHSGLRYDPEMGDKVVLHVTASGKAWLAAMPDERALALATAHPSFGARDGFGPRALRDISELRAILAHVRENGYAIAEEEGAAGMSAAAAVVRAGPGADAAVVGTVSIAGPSLRLTSARLAASASAIVAAAAELSEVWPIRRHLSRAERVA